MNALIEPGFVTPEMCQSLIEEYEAACLAGKGFVYVQRNVSGHELSERVRALGEGVRMRLVQTFGVDLSIDTHFLTRLDVGQQHVTHADCEKREGDGWVPNHTSWRTHSAILYLNDNFVGGEFYFTTPLAQHRPVPGTLIAFPADRRFEHGVLPLRAGVRYTMPMWFK